MKQSTKRLLHLAGALISLILVVYLVSRFFELRAAVASQLQNGFPLVTLALASTVCLLAYLPISIAWALLVSEPGRGFRNTPVSLEIVLLSQAARYLPGNVGHLVGRVMLTRRYLDVTATRGSALVTIELLLSLACAALLSSASIPQLAPLAPHWLAHILVQPTTVVIGVCTMMVVLIIAGAASRRWLKFSLPAAPTLLSSAFFYAAALLVGGYALWLLLNSQHVSAVSLSLALLAYTTSWLAGFVTPGAPSGLGVREFILVQLLAPAVGEPQALLAAALLRLCSVSADVVAFGIGLLLTRHFGRIRTATKLAAG